MRPTLLLTLALAASCGAPPDVAEKTSAINLVGAAWTSANGNPNGNGVIPVCFWRGSSATWDADGAKWIRQAVEDHWARYADIAFTGWGWCTSANQPAQVQVTLSDSNPMSDADGMRKTGPVNVYLNTTYAQWSLSASCSWANPTMDRRFCTSVAATHEFGHVLGFAHEQARGDNYPSGSYHPYCDRLDTPADLSTAGNTLGTPYDTDSDMNYCSDNVRGTGLPSAGDIVALQTLYGRKPAGAIVGYRGFVVDVTSSGTANGTKLHDWPVNKTNAQKWTYNLADQTFRSAVAANKCMDNPGWSQTNGTQLQIWDCKTSDNANQQWTRKWSLIGYGGRCLSRLWDSNIGRYRAVLARCKTDQVQQVWTFNADGSISAAANADGTGGQVCLDVPGGYPGGAWNGNWLQLYPCTPGSTGSNQKWTFDPQGRLWSQGASGYCVDVDSSVSFQASPHVQLWQCGPQLNQKWFLRAGAEEQQSGQPPGVVGYANMCVDLDSSLDSTDLTGNKVDIYQCGGRIYTAQTWDYYPTGSYPAVTEIGG